MPRSRLRSPAFPAILAAALLVVALGSDEVEAQEQEAESVAPFVPTPRHVAVEMLELAGVSERDTVYDLGSGDGRLPLAAARLYGAHGAGVELDSGLVSESRARARASGLDGRVRFLRGDLFQADLDPASVVTLYLFPKANVRLRPRLFRQLDPGDRVVAHDFAMGEWEADSVVRVPAAGPAARTESVSFRDSSGILGPAISGGAGTGSGQEALVDHVFGTGDLGAGLGSPSDEDPSPVPGPSTLYLWVIPAELEGVWSIDLPDGRAETVRIDQRFQELRVRPSEGRIGDASARVHGEEIRLRLELPGGETLRLRGTARDGRMEGRTADGVPWSARRLERTEGSILEWSEGTGS